MSRNGIVLAGVVAFGALIAISAQPVHSQRAAVRADARQKWEYLMLSFPDADDCSAHGAGLNFDGTMQELAKKLNIRLDDPMKVGSGGKFIAEAMDHFGAEGWELAASDTATNYDNIHRAYVFKRAR